MAIMKMRVGTCSMLFSTLCVVSGFFGWSQAFLQPSTIFTSQLISPRGHRAAKGSSVSRGGGDTRPRRTCRMSSTHKNGRGGGGDEQKVPLTVNPLVAVAVGATLLASDPAVTLAAQSFRDSLLAGPQQMQQQQQEAQLETGAGIAGTKATIFLAADAVKANTELKAVLGEYKVQREKKAAPAPTPTTASAPSPTPEPNKAQVTAPTPPAAPAVSTPAPTPPAAPAVSAPAPTPKAAAPAKPAPKAAAPKKAPSGPSPQEKGKAAAKAKAAAESAKADKEKKEKEARAVLEEKKRAEEAKRNALVDNIKSAQANFGAVPARPPTKSLGGLSTKMKSAVVAVKDPAEVALDELRARKAAALANVRKQTDAIAGAKDSVKAQSKILEKAEKKIADDKYKIKVNKSERVRQRLGKNLEMQTKIAAEARASIKGSEAIIKDGGRQLKAEASESKALAKLQTKAEADLKAKKEKQAKDVADARAKASKEEKKAKEKALQATRARGEKQQKDAAKAREDRKKQEQVKLKQARDAKAKALENERQERLLAKKRAEQEAKAQEAAKKKAQEIAKKELQAEKRRVAEAVRAEKRELELAARERESATRKAEVEARKRVKEASAILSSS